MACASWSPSVRSTWRPLSSMPSESPVLRVVDGWHYIESRNGPAQLFYLPDDPAQLHDLMDSAPAPVIADLKAALDQAFNADTTRNTGPAGAN